MRQTAAEGSGGHRRGKRFVAMTVLVYIVTSSRTAPSVLLPLKSDSDIYTFLANVLSPLQLSCAAPAPSPNHLPMVELSIQF